MLSHSSRTKVVLLAEDEPGIRGMMKLVLEAHGYTVISADDGEKAFGLFLRFKDRVSLVIADWDMPRINGIQLRQMLLGERADLKVLLISGAVPARERPGGFIRKPFSLSQFLAAVRELLVPTR